MSGAQQIVSRGSYEIAETDRGSAVLRWSNTIDPDAGIGEQEIPAEVWRILRAVMAGQKIGPQAALRLLSGGRAVRRGLE